MPDKILVAYATCTGSTAGVADVIGAALRHASFPARRTAPRSIPLP
ncbi:MAG: hypothetical protein R2844_05945 [Caldilineales bacterium]